MLSFFLTELRRTNPQSDAILTNFRYSANLTQSTFKRRLVRRIAKGALLFRFALENWYICLGAQSERIVFVVGQGYLVQASFIARLFKQYPHVKWLQIIFQKLSNKSYNYDHTNANLI